MPVWNDKMTGHQAGSGQVSVNSAFTWSLLLSNAYQFCSSNVWVLQHHSVHASDMSTIIVLGLQQKWNQLSSNNSRHTSCIHKGLHSGKWSDLMTSIPDAPSTLGYRVRTMPLWWQCFTHIKLTCIFIHTLAICRTRWFHKAILYISLNQIMLISD